MTFSSCETGLEVFFRVFLQRLIRIWKRIRPFYGTVVAKRSTRVGRDRKWAVVAMQVRNKKKIKWHNCIMYQIDKVKFGDKVIRIFPGKIFVLKSNSKLSDNKRR